MNTNTQDITTHQLTGSETEIHCPRYYALATNNGYQTVTMSKDQDIATQSEDDVTIVEAGLSDYLPTDAINERVFAVGTGEIEIEHTDSEIECLKKKVQTNFQTLRSAVSAPNILINPDFSINQRVQTVYTRTGFTADRWYLAPSSQSAVCSFSTDNNDLSLDSEGHYVTLRQYIDLPERLSGLTVTFSVKLKETPNCSWNIQIWKKTESGSTENLGIATTEQDQAVLTCSLPDISATDRLVCLIAITEANSVISIEHAKLEKGRIATNYTPAEPSCELLKCQRFYQLRSAADIDPLDLRPTMHHSPTVEQTTDGYAYIAEITT